MAMAGGKYSQDHASNTRRRTQALSSVPFILWKCEVEACSVLLPRQQTAGGSVSTTDSISPRQSMFCVPFGLEIIQGIKNDVCSLYAYRKLLAMVYHSPFFEVD
jgi:hypothetical protein